MFNNRKKDMTPFRNPDKIKRQNPFLLRLIWLISYIMAGGKKCRIKRIGMEDVKPPYLLLSEHQGFPDYYLTPLALYPHRATYVSDIEGFAHYGKWLYSGIGCIGTRRFTNEIGLVRSIFQVVRQNKDIIVIYPEACHSSVGTNRTLPVSVGKLAKKLGVPVVIQKMYGSYLTSPVWDEEHTRKVPLSVSLHKILDPGQLKELPASQITEIINQNFHYNEYQWQYENKIAIDYPKRAEGLHRVLYQCPSCKKEFGMVSSRNLLKCSYCSKEWAMDEYGQLAATQGKTEFSHIPDWYQFQKDEVKKQLAAGQYRFNGKVRIEAMPSEKGFVDLGTGLLVQGEQEMVLTIADTGQKIVFPHRNVLHVEYNYRGKGDCIVLSTSECCYYLYPLASECNVTKVQFAVEAGDLL